MKTKLQRLALAAIMLSPTSITWADQGASSVGDLPGYGEEAYYHEDGAYAETYVTPAGHTGSTVSHTTSPSADYAPVGASQFQQASCHTGGCDISCGCEIGCDVGCDVGCGGCGSCDSACGSTISCGSLFKRCNSWATAEAIMWWAPDRDMPPLVTTAPEGQLPILGLDGTLVEYGDPINGEMSAGVRLDAGVWASDNVGFGGRVWGLAESNDSYFNSGNGTGRSIGRPFLNVGFGDEDALLVNIDGTALAGPSFAGQVAANSVLQIWAAEAYSRLRFTCAKNCRLEFIGGYSHFEIDDQLLISSQSINVANPATGRTRTFSDLFDIENEFNGGQIGFEMIIKRGRWMARSLTKVHLGNMRQHFNIAGVKTDDVSGTTTISPGGMLAQGNNLGVFEQDTFAFAPEANFKLAYCLKRGVWASVGYSFIYWDNVALTGDVVDRVITDGTFFSTPNQSVPRPAFRFDDSSLWVQGIDLGVVIDF